MSSKEFKEPEVVAILQVKGKSFRVVLVEIDAEGNKKYLNDEAMFGYVWRLKAHLDGKSKAVHLYKNTKVKGKK